MRSTRKQPCGRRSSSRSVAAPVAGSKPWANRASISVKFKYLKWAFCVANQACYAFALATAAGVEVRAAALGTHAEYDSAGDRLMNVYSGFTAHFTFYKNYLGFAFDPEGRRYAVYKAAGLSCPSP